MNFSQKNDYWFMKFSRLKVWYLDRDILMSTNKLKQKIEKIELQKKAEYERLEQFKRQQQAAKQQLRNVQSTEQRKADIKLRVLMGSYLIKLLRNDPQIAQQYKSKLIEYFALEKNERARAKNLELLESLFISIECRRDDY